MQMQNFEKHVWAEIDLDALRANFRTVKQRAGSLPLCAVVKADSYGHGAVQCARIFAQEGASWLAVSCLAEALQLRRSGQTLPILILGHVQPAYAAALIRDDITAACYSLPQAQALSEAAQAAGVELNLVTGWQDADTRTAAYEARLTAYQTENSRLTGETAAAHTASLQPTASTSEQGTGYCADILSPDCTERSEAFAETRAYEWLTAYAADYGFILRWPEERQSATGMVYAPWHWRYVGVENARAIRESGLSLEEFLALERAKQ